MFYFLLILHAVLCLSMIGLVLLQQGKGADAGAIMGGSGDSVFGPGGGGSFASRLTTGIAVGFMVTSILLVKAYGSGAYVKKEAPSPLKGSIMEEVQPPAPENAGASGSVKPEPAKADAGAEPQKAPPAESGEKSSVPAAPAPQGAPAGKAD